MIPTARSWAWLLVSVSTAASCNELPKIQPDSSSSAGSSGDASNAGSPSRDDSSRAGQSAAGDCVPGQTRCHGQLGFQRCAPDGTWGSSQTCAGYSENGTSSYCAMVDEGEGPWAACIDPACWWWLQNGAVFNERRVGVCTSAGQIRACGPTSLGASEACAGGCRRVGELDGEVLGVCEESCTEGERECLGGPIFRECVGGAWRAGTCENALDCVPSGAGPSSYVLCGEACVPGTSRCSGEGAAVERCTDERRWERLTPCALGRCVQSGPQAQCQAECRPGELICAFDGASEARACNEHGVWEVPVACATGTSCRIGTAGALGCLACVGAEQRGGNAWGIADSRCVDGSIEACGVDDTYAERELCPTACSELKRGAARLAYCK